MIFGLQKVYRTVEPTINTSVTAVTGETTRQSQCDKLVDKKTLRNVADWRNKMILTSLFLFLCFTSSRIKYACVNMPLKRRESKKWLFKQFQTFRMNHHDTVVKNKPFPCYSPVLRFYLCRNSSIMHKHPKSTREIMFCADNVAQQRSTLDRFLFKNAHYHLVDSTHSSTTCVPKVSQTFRVFVQTFEGVQVNLGTPFF